MQRPDEGTDQQPMPWWFWTAVAVVGAGVIALAPWWMAVLAVLAALSWAAVHRPAPVVEHHLSVIDLGQAITTSRLAAVRERAVPAPSYEVGEVEDAPVERLQIGSGR